MRASLTNAVSSGAFLGAFLLGGLVSGCDEKKDETPKVPPAPPEVVAQELGFDASAFTTDPPAPAGDLKVEIDNFVNLETCVSQHAKLEPLVGDALGAIGYETFLHDSCRMLEAAKDRKKETCERIDSSPLRRKCRSWVAILAQAPDQCPLEYDAVVTRGRVPSCVAIAARDPRLCAGEGRAAPRAACEAMVNRDPARCSVLGPAPKAACERELARWKLLLSPPLEGLDKLPVPKETLTLGERDAGVSDAGAADVDLGSDIASGVVLVTAGERSRLEIGSLVESELAHLAAAPTRRPRIGFTLLGAPKPAIQKLEIIVPNEAPYVSPPAQCDCKIANVKIGTQRGSEVSFTIEGKVNAALRTQPFAVNVTTFVRDVVSDREGGGLRTIPALPPKPVRDGG